ncbi:MAG: Nif3-like dinuclear metal center hexameric protein [Bacillota bacterium]
MITVSEIAGKINKLAPSFLAENWDNIGLQVGNPDCSVNKIGVALDATPEIINEAIEKECQLLIVHHPLIFNGIKNVHTGNTTGKIITKAIQSQLSIIAAHTNVDHAENGLNDYLANILKLFDVKNLSKQLPLKKFIGYIPESDFEKVRTALFDAGAGKFGNYDQVSFSSQGNGSFRPLEGSNPTKGNHGERAEVLEYRLEVIVDERDLDRIISTYYQVHPYEEPVFDIFQPEQLQGEYLPARIGFINNKMKLADFANFVNNKLNLDYVQVAGKKDKEIKKVAIACGSGSDFIKAASRQGADVLVTGDVKYHEAQSALESGIALINAGHYGTEKVFSDLIINYLDDIEYSSADKPDIIKLEEQEPIWKLYTT